MTAAIEYNINPTSSTLNVSSSIDCQMLVRFIADSNVVYSLNLIGWGLSDSRPKNRESVLWLSDRDRDIFLNALNQPRAPNEYLRNAYANYHKNKRKDS